MGSRHHNSSREAAPARTGISGHPSDDHRLFLRRQPHPSVLEDRVAAQHREIQNILVDNQRLAAVHLALKQDLSDAQQDLLSLSAAASSVKAEREARVREVYERSFRLEAELRSVEAMSTELAQVQADIQKLAATRQELSGKLKAVDSDIARALVEARQLPVAMEEIEGMHHEIQRGRAAVEYEKKTHAINLEHAKEMEKNMSSVAREVEYLRAQLAEAEKRAQAAAAERAQAAAAERAQAVAAANPSGGYAGTYASHELGYGGSSYSGRYSHYNMHQVPGGASASPQFAPSAMPHSYGMPQTDMPR